MMNSKKIVLLAILACTGMGAGVAAQAQGLPTGPNIVYGYSSNPQTAFSAIGNPAAPAASLPKGRSAQIRFGLVSAGMGLELGKVQADEVRDASDELEALSDETDFNVDDDQTLLEMKTDVVNQINPLFSPLNRLLGNLSQGNLMALNAGVQPFTPFVLTLPALGGSLVLDTSQEVVLGVNVLHDDFASWTTDDIAITGIAQLAAPTIQDVVNSAEVQTAATVRNNDADPDNDVDLNQLKTDAELAGTTAGRTAALSALNTLNELLTEAIAATAPPAQAALIATQEDLVKTRDAVEDEDDPDTAADKQVQLNASDGTAKTKLKNDSTLLVRAATIEKVGVGYSRVVWNYGGTGRPDVPAWKEGSLATGVRVKFYRVGLKRYAVRMADGEDAIKQFEKDVEKDEDIPLSTGFGVDAGVLWTNPRYRAGLWVNNVNSPKFKYNRLDMTTYENPNGDVVNSLAAGKTYEMKPQVHVEGAWTPFGNFVFNVTADANESPDPIGRDYQWVTASAAYATNTWWIPGLRAGYRKNLAGSELSYGTLGMRWLGVDLDVAAALENMDLEGDSVPRGMMLYLSSSMSF